MDDQDYPMAATTEGGIHLAIVEYNPEWPNRFEREADRMHDILGSRVHKIEHIGSTSVPGLAAKPIIDICPIVSDMAAAEECKQLLKRHDYRLNKDRDDWISFERLAPDGQQFNSNFRKSEEIEKYLLLRDYLRDHPQAREEYADIKREAVKKYPTDVTAYTHEKSEFIDSTIEKAREQDYEYDV